MWPMKIAPLMGWTKLMRLIGNIIASGCCALLMIASHGYAQSTAKASTNSGVALTGASSDDIIKAIVKDCTQSDQECRKDFVDYEFSNQEKASNGNFNILNIFGGSRSKFWGMAQDLSYTELIYDEPYDTQNGDGLKGSRKIEYQLGFGYMLYARQKDAKIDAQGTVSQLALAGTFEKNETVYSAMVIGLAPLERQTDAAGAVIECGQHALEGPDALLCALDLQPVVTQGYYEAAAAKFAAAYGQWRGEEETLAKGVPYHRICPQVINFRDAVTRDAKLMPDKAIIDRVRLITNALAPICTNPRPNARMAYHSGGPHLTVTGGPTGSASGKFDTQNTQVTQAYYRNQVFLADTNKREFDFYRPLDKRVQIVMHGLSDSAALPSILASIVTYTQTDLAQRLHVSTHCIGGAALIGPADNPVTDAAAFTKMVGDLRKSVDTKDVDPSMCIDKPWLTASD